MTTPFPRSIKFSSGALLLLAALALGGCETTGAGTAGPAAQAAAGPAAPLNPMAGEKPSKSKGPMTHRQAALYCWMKTEHGHADLPLDKRADVVDKCIKEKMQGG